MAEQSIEVVSLSTLSPVPGSKRSRKRVGVGEGSGHGKTCGKGQKGQRSRSGFSLPAGFEGGQMPIHRRLPKRGFVSRKKTLGKNVFSLVPIKLLQELAVEGEITLEVLRTNGIVRSKNALVKILGGSELTKKIVVEAHAASKSARAAIEGAGGEVKILENPIAKKTLKKFQKKSSKQGE